MGWQVMALTPNLTAHWDELDSYTVAGYERHYGYQALRKALEMDPDAIIGELKESGLRGRGGAGFPTGMKWSFVPQGDGKPHYLVVNADESEPGACKDIPLMLASSQHLIEGMIIASYAIRANHAFVYIRGEVPHVIRRMHAAVRDAYDNGYLGKNILGSGFDLDITVHGGAGAYICGEETALLQFARRHARAATSEAAIPAVAGLYACPTVVNNVETIASVPAIIRNGGDWYALVRHRKVQGHQGVCGLRSREQPRNLRSTAGITMRELLGYAYESAMATT